MDNKITKAAAGGVASDAGSATAEELELINTYTRRTLTAGEVYVFTVVLCDNDVDRDGERFTVESLFALEKLFVGKTGIFDHNPSAKNQTARIISCKVENVASRTTATGDEYFCLKARAYLPRTEGNSELIAALDSGIVKEVSVGCAVGKILCSVCGEDIGMCPHRKGETYGGKLCCGELTEPYDAYEWSFVAVPAQKNAGVTKTAYGKEIDMEGIMKKLSRGQSLQKAARIHRQPQAERQGRRVLPRQSDHGGAAPFGGGTAGYFARNNRECDKGYVGCAAQGVQKRI